LVSGRMKNAVPIDIAPSRLNERYTIVNAGRPRNHVLLFARLCGSATGSMKLRKIGHDRQQNACRPC